MIVKDVNKIHDLAHKLNSPLTAILGYLSLAKNNLNSPGQLKKVENWLNDAEEASIAMKEIAKQLNELTKP